MSKEKEVVLDLSIEEKFALEHAEAPKEESENE